MSAEKTILSPDEKRARRQLRREKQRAANVGRAAKMQAVRLQNEAKVFLREDQENLGILHVGCSGWFYWEWKGLFYPLPLPTNKWFSYYADNLDTVEINASFYAWPTVANVQAWKRQAIGRKFVYTVKVCELITHIKRFTNTKTLVKDFTMIADILGENMGCFLFQLPPSYRYTPARLNNILGQLDPKQRNVVEFRHTSWWNEDVYAAFRKCGIIFCSCSAPGLPDALVRTADDVYVRMHGPLRWYRHNYSQPELHRWAEKIAASGAKRTWIYFNNTFDAHAPENAATLRKMIVNLA